MNPQNRLRILGLVAALLALAALPAAGQKTLARLLPAEAASLPPKIAPDDAAVAFRVGPELARLASEHALHRAAPAAAFVPSNPLVRLRGERVLIDAVAAGDAAALHDRLAAAGLRDGARYGRTVSGYLPIAAIAELAGLDELRFARPSYPAAGVGSVVSQGDAAMETDLARMGFPIDGSGVTVGTMSDSFDCLGGAAGDVASMDLPAGITVLDDSECPSGSDEGRAMMQIVADVAPGAAQGFHKAFGGQAVFALGIEELAGCPPGSDPACTPSPGFAADVINDDVFYFTEPFFQDGIIAQAVDHVVANGVTYFSLAGNHGRKSWEGGPFTASGATDPIFGGPLHDFDPGPGVDPYQSITVPVGKTVVIAFQWDNPYFSLSGAPGASGDYDIFVFDETGTSVLAGGAVGNFGGDPIEVMSFENGGGFDFDGVPGPDTTFNIGISKFFGADTGLLKYIALVNGDLGAFTVNEFDTASSTIYGHMNSAGAITVGAAFYFDTPPFGTSPAMQEPFSSAGGLPVLFDATGAPTTILRDKPDVVAPDGGNNTFFGGDITDPGDGSDLDSDPNFPGTSAATPHAAGLAAMLLESSNLTPAGVRQMMRAAAAENDMGPPGFDEDSGFGYLLSLDLLESIVHHVFLPIGCGLTSYGLSGTPNDGDQTFRATDSILWGDGSFFGVEGLAPEHIFADGFESGDVSSWSSGCP